MHGQKEKGCPVQSDREIQRTQLLHIRYNCPIKHAAEGINSRLGDGEGYAHWFPGYILHLASVAGMVIPGGWGFTRRKDTLC